MITNHPAASAPIADIQVNTYLLHAIFHRRKRTWAFLGIIVFVGLLLYNLFLVPQIFSATVSISMQQSATIASPIAALVGGGGGKKYNGVLKSRSFAEYVEHKVHMQALFHMPKHEDALDFLTKVLKIDDNPNDGLLYLTVDLGGPARFTPHAEMQREQVKETTAAIANAYAAALRRYLIESDTDRETVLMREAEKQFKLINQAYLASADQLSAFIKGTRGDKTALAEATTQLVGSTGVENSDADLATTSSRKAGEVGVGQLTTRRIAE